MGLLTKNVKPVAEYQQWAAADMAAGDILGVFESLGRGAHTVTIESIGGASTVRFNVANKVYGNYGPLNESWVGLGQGALRPRPVLVDEVKETKPNIVIEANNVQTWTSQEISISDIEIVAMAIGLKITVT